MDCTTTATIAVFFKEGCTFGDFSSIEVLGCYIRNSSVQGFLSEHLLNILQEDLKLSYSRAKVGISAAYILPDFASSLFPYK